MRESAIRASIEGGDGGSTSGTASEDPGTTFPLPLPETGCVRGGQAARPSLIVIPPRGSCSFEPQCGGRMG